MAEDVVVMPLARERSFNTLEDESNSEDELDDSVLSPAVEIPPQTLPVEAATNAPEPPPQESQPPIEPQPETQPVTQPVSTERSVVVQVQFENGSTKEIAVTIVPSNTKKPFLGGFRSKKTSTEYHNASSQTPKAIRNRTKDLLHRQTQTVQVSSGATNCQQTTRTSATQMTKPGVFVSSVFDHTVAARAYETADEREARILKKEIQRKIKMDEDEKTRTLQRRINPASKQDFDLLLSGLQAWRQDQNKLIESLPADQQARAKLDLQRQETRYLTSIERLRHMAKTQNKDVAVQAFLDKVAEPRQWVDPVYGKVNQMETLDIRRARELRDLYKGLSMTELTREERLAMLQTIRSTVQEHDSKLTRDIVELLDREEDLMQRNVRGDNLEGLRKRTLNLFLLYCETPQYNPEAARVHKVHQPFKADVRLCSGCGRFLSSKAFDASPVAHVMGRCRQCAHVHNVATGRKDPTPFEAMLRGIQEDEAAREEPSRLCFMVTADDVHTLVDKVWGARSALSQHAELHHLTLARWDRQQPWAPWNCVLLTHDEAAAHAKLPALEEAYAEALIARVRHRCIQARVLFRRLAEQDEEIQG